MPSQQKALFLQDCGLDFELGSTEIYKPAAGELLVKLKASALNPADWKMKYNDFGFFKYPIVLGTDMAGDIVEVGEGVQGFTVGDKVFFQGDFTSRNDGFQQYTTTPPFRAAKIPAGFSYDQAASIPLVLFTAWSGFYNSTQGLGISVPMSDDSAKGKYANTPIVIIGGASSVGQMAIQLAKLSGLSPIITTVSLKNEATLKSLGATHVIDRTLPLSSLPSEVSKITDKPITLVFDAISYEDTAQAGYDLLVNGGKIVLRLKALERQSSLLCQCPYTPENVKLVKDLYANLPSLLETGVIVPNRVEALPDSLLGIIDGLRRLENNKVSAAKLIAHPDETA